MSAARKGRLQSAGARRAGAKRAGAKRAGARQLSAATRRMNAATRRMNAATKRGGSLQGVCVSLLRSKAKSTTHGRHAAVTVTTSSLGEFWIRTTHPKASRGATRGSSARRLPLEGAEAFPRTIRTATVGAAPEAGLAVPNSRSRGIRMAGLEQL